MTNPLPTPAPTSLTPADESSKLGEELGAILVSPKPDVIRLNHLMQQLKELGDQQRKSALAEVRKKAKENPKHPLATQLDGPPSRKYLPSIKSIQEVAEHTHGKEKTTYQMSEKNLRKALAVASSRQRLIAHMLPVGLPLADPQLLGKKVEGFAHSQHAPNASLYADWLGANLSGKNLDGANLQGAFLDGANLQDASLIGANLENTTFVGANLSNTDLTKANLKGANLGGARLHNTKLHGANLEQVIFDKAYLDGVDCQDANMTKTSFLSIQCFGVINFTNANLSYSKWTGIDMEADLEKISAKSPSINDVILPMDIGAINFTGANLSFAIMLGCTAKKGISMAKVNFSKASLQRCCFIEGDFSGAEFISTNVVLGSTMEKSNFVGAKINASFFHGANLSQSNFHLASLDKTNFSLANMQNCSLIQVSAAGSHFERASLFNATFLSSKMVGAIFRNANLTGACFDDCDLTHADFSKATSAKSPTFINANLSRALLPSS